MDLPLILAVCALAVSAAAVVRCYVPPQRRDVFELRETVADLVEHVELMDKRVIARTARENMDKARSAHEERKRQRDRVVEDAAAVIEAAGKATAAPADEESLRAQLRARVGLTKH